MPAPGSAWRLWFALFVLAASVAAPLAGPVAASSSSAQEVYLVGFHQLPADALADGRWANRTVLGVLETLDVARIAVEDAERFRRAMDDRSNVAYVEPDRPSVEVVFTPDDPRYPDQVPPGQIGLPTAWQGGLGDASVRVAVVDTGIRDDHEDLAGAVVLERDLVNGDDDAEDACGHGTHVAGMLAARTDNSVGIAGTAKISLIDVKALGVDDEGHCTGTVGDVAEAIRWSADENASIISMSIGTPDASRTLERAVEYAAGQGALLVAAAGNDGPCSACVRYPAAYPEVVAVACTDDAEDRCSFSSQGPEVELAAPGLWVLSTTADGGYGRMSGTSMSTPWVSGTAALALSADPNLDRDGLRSVLADTVEDLGAEGRDDRFGRGEVDAAEVLRNVTDNLPPKARMTVACDGGTCRFDAAESTDPDGDRLSYAWRFGDGTAGTGATVEHTYPEGGTYEVQLAVSDGEATATLNRMLEVRLELRLTARTTEAAYTPFERPTVEVTLERNATGEGVPDAEVTVQTRWVPEDGPAPGEVEAIHGQALASPVLLELLAPWEVVYHADGTVTDASGSARVVIPSEAGTGLTAPTPGHRVLVSVAATIQGQTYEASTTYRVGLLT